jgi:hypothetical protein
MYYMSLMVTSDFLVVANNRNSDYQLIIYLRSEGNHVISLASLQVDFVTYNFIYLATN